MSNSKKIVSITFAGAAVAATTTFVGVGPAHAVSCKVKQAGVCYRGPLKEKNKAGTVAVMGDTTKNTTLTCKKATWSGAITNSVGPIIGSIKKSVTKWSSCAGPFGLTFKAHMANSPNLFVNGGAARPAGNSSVRIKISGLGLFNTCRATISGLSIPGKYLNATHSWDVNSTHKVTLRVKSLAGFCGGAIAAGDLVFYSGIDHVSVPNALTIS